MKAIEQLSTQLRILKQAIVVYNAYELVNKTFSELMGQPAGSDMAKYLEKQLEVKEKEFRRNVMHFFFVANEDYNTQASTRDAFTAFNAYIKKMSNTIPVETLILK